MHSFTVFSFDVVTSTMDVARSLYEENREDGIVVLANYQTNGRGRPGRVWHTKKDENFLTTLVLNVDGIPFAVLPFLISLSLIETLMDLTKSKGLSLKWPNDLLFHKKKLGGILIEKIDDHVFSIGIGLNLRDAPKDLDSGGGMLFPPVALNDYFQGYVPTNEEIVSELFSHINKNESLYREKGFDPIREKWLSHHLPVGTLMSVKLSQQSYQGTFVDLTSQGHLILELSEGGHKTFATGDVFI